MVRPHSGVVFDSRTPPQKRAERDSPDTTGLCGETPVIRRVLGGEIQRDRQKSVVASGFGGGCDHAWVWGFFLR